MRVPERDRFLDGTGPFCTGSFSFSVCCGMDFDSIVAVLSKGIPDVAINFFAFCFPSCIVVLAATGTVSPFGVAPLTAGIDADRGWSSCARLAEVPSVCGA